jgi:hypothetical protein
MGGRLPRAAAEAAANVAPDWQNFALKGTNKKCDATHPPAQTSEVVLCPISYCRDVFSPYLGKILDFVVVHWSFIFVSYVSRLIVKFI